MVALPSLSTPRTQPVPARPGQPIALPQRPPRDSAAWPLLAPDTHPSQFATSYPTSPSIEQQLPPAQPAQQQLDDEEAAASEEAAAYSPLLKDHAFALYCAGQRSPAIAAQLGISERTVRHWVRATLQQLAQDDVTASPDAARQQRALAIESQRAASASAWATYHRLTAAHNHLLDRALMHAMRQSDPAADAPQADVAAVAPDPQRLFITAQRIASSAARYLALVISANREIAHLQGQATAQDARERHATAARDAADARQLEADLIRAFTTPILPPESAPRPLPPYGLRPTDGTAASRTLPTGAAINTTTTAGAPTTTAPDPTTAALIAALRANFQDDPAAVRALTNVPVCEPRALQRGLPAKTAQPPHPPAAQPELPAKTATPLAVAQSSTQSETAAKTATPSSARATMPTTERPNPSTQTQQSAKLTPRATPKTSKTLNTSKTSMPPHPRRPASANRNKPQLILPPKP